MTSRSELEFLAWLGSQYETIGFLPITLPRDVFSPEGYEIYSRIEKGEHVALDTPRYTDHEASEFLQDQILALFGREVGRAQSSKSLAKVQWVNDLLLQCDGILHPLPVFDYHDVVPNVREVVRTGLVPLDEQIRGLGNGELGILALPPGRGKTAALINFTVTALLDGYDVLYITVADQGLDEIVPRIDTCVLGTPGIPDASQEVLGQRHVAAMKHIKGHLAIADYTDRECSLTDIVRIIDQHSHVSLVIVDHADDVVSPFSTDPTVTRHSLRVVYMALKKLARKYNVPVWTASQTHEMSWTFDSAGINELAEAKTGKATGASIVLAFTGGRKPVPGLMYAHIAKARRNYSQRTFPLSVDFSRCRIW